ncbi:hypothetical protein [Ramlibacter sp.]|uniref:hypothetical protein n=1 Tax=Ramlibacter sp. TaxID=1917967 RepID=UPI002FCA8414
MKVLSALFAAGTLLAAAPALACYTVHDAQGRIVYQAQEPPVDMSRPLHETVDRIAPGGHLVFGDSLDCQVQSPSRTFLQATSSGSPPLLTHERTARAMGLPYTRVAEGIALVPDRPDDMRPGVVLAGSGLAGAVPDTRAMGAGPAGLTAGAPGTVMRRVPRSSAAVPGIDRPPAIVPRTDPRRR